MIHKFRRLRVALATALLVCLATGCKSTPKKANAPAPPQPLTAQQVQKNVESFDLIWITVRDKHFDPKLNGVDWNAVKAELRPKVENAKTMDEARAAMSEMIGRLGQTHFAVIPASLYHEMSSKGAATKSDASKPEAEDDDDSVGDGESGIHLRIVDGKAVVVRVEAGSAGASAGVKPGWELVSVKGRDLAPRIAALEKAFENQSLQEGMASLTIEHSLRGNIGEKVATQFIDGSGAKRAIELTMDKNSGTPAKFGNLPTMYVRYESRRLPQNIQYFYLNTFFDPPHVMNAFRTAIESSSDADGFIIDLRGNPGGIGVMAMGMGNWFVSEQDQKLGTMQTRGGSLKFVLNPQGTTFTKPVAILVDGASMSTSEIFAGGLQDLKRARVFGTRTGGAALPSTVIKLPNGDGFQYAFANYTSTGGKVLEGNGVMPDVVVKPDRASLLAGKDPILDAAVTWIKNPGN